MIKILKQFIRHVFSDTLYVCIKLLGKTFSLGPDETRSNLSKACLNKISPVTEKTHIIHIQTG